MLYIFSLSSSLYSQNLTMSQIVDLQNKNIAEIEEFLTSKNWNYIGTEDENINFSYNQSAYSSEAESFITVLPIGEYNLIGIQIHSKSKYTEYLNAIKSYGCTLLDSGISDYGNLYKIYQGKTTTFKVLLSNSDNEFSSVATIYYISILLNIYYDILDSDSNEEE